MSVVPVSTVVSLELWRLADLAVFRNWCLVVLASALFVHLPLLSWIMAMLVVGWSATWFAVVWRRGSFADCPWWWGAIDVASGVAALVWLPETWTTRGPVGTSVRVSPPLPGKLPICGYCGRLAQPMG